MGDEMVKILNGNTFVVSDQRGDIEASSSDPTGLFSFDTRFLSTWRLTIDGQRLYPLSVDDLHYFESRFFLVQGVPTPYLDARVSVLRHRVIGGSFEEDVTVLNHAGRQLDLLVRLEVGSDFADILELMNKKVPERRTKVTIADRCLRLSYERGTFRRWVSVSSSAAAEVDDHGLTFAVHLEPGGEWRTDLHVETMVETPDGRDFRVRWHEARGEVRTRMQSDLDRWLAGTPKLKCDSPALSEAYSRGLVDVGALRYIGLTSIARIPAAGLPWYMTQFGRDSALVSLQMLPFTPELASAALPVLAGGQGTVLNDFREEEPGKILDEVRYGELAAFEEEPHSPYYGSADSTPLFVILLDEYERWTGDSAMVRNLQEPARAALDWINTYANLMGDGYIWYQRRNTKNGLDNQCWKDSPDSISYRDGRIPGLPRATCELQGYAYDAKIRGARLARRFWNDPVYAERLEAEAADLKARFNRDFWVADGEYYALALDADGRQVDALSSNIGHLLWSGIVDDSRAPQVVRHLLGPRLFSGWGVRTLADGEGRYNPVGYHVGTVWPFDNSFIAWGLWRYGFREEAGRIAAGIIEAAPYFDGRLPEAFAGYHRALTKFPVEYPTACSPRAWSSAAPMLLLRVILGMEPRDEHLTVKPALPESITEIELDDIPGRWGRTDAFARR